MRRAFFFSLVAVLLAGVAVAQHPNANKAAELQAGGYDSWTAGQTRGDGPVLSNLDTSIALPGGTEDTATMQYDSGTIDALPVGFGIIFGNKFNLGVGGVELDTITLNSFSFYFAEDSTPDTTLFVQASDPGATPNQIISRVSFNVTGLVNNGSSFSMLTTVNVVPQSVLGTTGMFTDTFFLGGWCLNANTAVPVDNETLGLSTGDVQQKGFTASSGTGTITGNATQTFNAVLRANVTSPATVPVELMAFEVND